jgi:hypothetical protein
MSSLPRIRDWRTKPSALSKQSFHKPALFDPVSDSVAYSGVVAETRHEFASFEFLDTAPLNMSTTACNFTQTSHFTAE